MAGNIQITVIQEIPNQRVSDMLCCAFEGGSNYWYIIKGYNYPAGQTKESLGIEFPHIELPLIEGGSLIIGTLGDEMPDTVLDKAALHKGLELMARDWPNLWHDLMSGNDDADTGDTFLQLALYGKVIFV